MTHARSLNYKFPKIIQLLKTASLNDSSIHQLGKEIFSLPLNDSKETALHICAKYNVLLIPYLLNQNSHPGVKDINGRTPFFYLLEQMRHIWIKPWITLQGLFSMEDRQHYFEKFVTIAIEMLKKGALPNTANAYGMNLMHIVVANLVLLSPHTTHYFVSTLLELGVQPDIKCRSSIFKDCDALAIHYFSMLSMNRNRGLSLISFETAALLIQGGCYNNLSVVGSSLLKLAAEESHAKGRYVALFSYLGCKPDSVMAGREYDRRYLPNIGGPFIFKEYEAPPKLGLDISPKELLQSIYASFPEMKQYFSEQHIPQVQLQNAEYIFNHINMADLRLHLNYLRNGQVLSRAKHEQMLILFYLINDWKNPHSTSNLNKLPWEMMLQILCMDTSNITQAADLANALLFHYDHIIELLRKPGGMCVAAKRKANHKYEFSFFKSTETLALNYQRLPAKASREERHHFRKNAYACWFEHSSRLPSVNAKLALLERIEGTELYKGAGLKL